MLSASLVSVGIVTSEQAPVCLYPIARCARARAHSTVVTSGNQRHQRCSEVRPNHHSGQMACRGFEACARLLSEEGAALAILVGPRPCRQGRGPFHVSRSGASR